MIARPRVLIVLFIGGTLMSICIMADWEASIRYSDKKASLYTDDVRCLASAVYTLDKDYNWLATYEDAPLEFKGDIVDVTSPMYHPKDPNDRAYNPRSGPISIGFDVPGPSKAPLDPELVLNAVVNAYQKAGYPGEYAVTEFGAFYHVMPTQMRDKSGTLVKVTPVFSTKVTLAAQPGRTVFAAMTTILHQVMAVTGCRIILGGIGDRSLTQKLYPYALKNIEARDALDQALKPSAIGNGRFWLLLYDPGAHLYGFTIY